MDDWRPATRSLLDRTRYVRLGRGSLLLLFVLGANVCLQPTSLPISNQTTDLSTANLTAIFDAASNEYKTRMHLFHYLSSFSPFPTSLALLPRTPTPGTHRARAPASHVSTSHATSCIMAALDELAQPLLIPPFRGCGRYRQAKVEPTRGGEGDEED